MIDSCTFLYSPSLSASCIATGCQAWALQADWGDHDRGGQAHPFLR